LLIPITEAEETQVSDFEQSLNTLDERLQEIQKVSKAVGSAVGRARTAAKLGRAIDIARLLDDIAKRIREADAAADGLSGCWRFDTSAYLSDGRFVDDLKAAAAQTGLELFQHDGRIYCFPLLLRVDPKATAIKIGRRMERRIRPSELARVLAATQKRPHTFREPQFLELLYRAWRLLAGADWRESGTPPAISLADIHETLTLLPGRDYPIEEFARDLLLLDRRPDLRTRDGCRFEFSSSTSSKGPRKRLVVYDELGVEHIYILIRFVKEG
jgi:hypothetical protein